MNIVENYVLDVLEIKKNIPVKCGEMEFLYNVYVLEVMSYGHRTITNYSILTKDDQGQIKKGYSYLA